MTGESDSNVGLKGDKSVRIAGKPLEGLDIRQQVETSEQLRVREVKEARVAILQKYPRYKVDAMRGQLKHCEANVTRMRDVVAKEEATIAEYTLLIKQCEQRDEELRRAGIGVN